MLVVYFGFWGFTMRYIPTTATFLLSLITWTLSTLSASAATLFLQDFDSLPVSEYRTGEIIPSRIGGGFLVSGSVGVRNQSTFFSQDIDAGNVADLNGLNRIVNGPFYITPISSLRSVETFNLNPGTVNLSFDLGATVSPGGASAIRVVLYDRSSDFLYLEIFTVPPNGYGSFTRITQTLDVLSPATVSLSFDLGINRPYSFNDSSHLLLDNVVLSTSDITTSIPEKSSPIAIYLSFFMGAWLFNKGNHNLIQKSK
jgi:hypothetical protein